VIASVESRTLQSVTHAGILLPTVVPSKESEASRHSILTLEVLIRHVPTGTRLGSVRGWERMEGVPCAWAHLHRGAAFFVRNLTGRVSLHAACASNQDEESA
jgi:hypothetical protein